MEYEHEPIPGLPGRLPPGESIVWQGAPEWRALARGVFHTRLVAGWFVFVAGTAFLAGGTGVTGAIAVAGVAIVGLGLLALLAWLQARSTIYTLTNRRVVMRFGTALPKCVNLPLSTIASADSRPAGTGVVDISLQPSQRFPLGYLQMWPHVRPWKFGQPQPMLRAVPASFVGVLAGALASADPSTSRPVAEPGTDATLLGAAA